MHKAFVLVRNLHSHVERLDFGEFTMSRIGLRYSELRELFVSQDVLQNDWLFAKAYRELPSGPSNSPTGVGGIPIDLEDILLLLRLYKVGDVAFVKQAIIKPDGSKLVQFPYWAMNNLNSDSVLSFEFDQGECGQWREFANGIRANQSWGSEWFAVARRFFLYGGAKEFNPRWDDVDRIVDYMTALQAAVVPEMDFSRRRISRRAARLVSPDDGTEETAVVQLVRQLYDIRSSIVHGSKLSNPQRDWLIENCAQVELRVRQVLLAAVQSIPAGEQERRTMLAVLYDLADEDRGEFALQKFQEVKTEAVRKEIAAKVSRLTA